MKKIFYVGFSLVLVGLFIVLSNSLTGCDLSSAQRNTDVSTEADKQNDNFVERSTETQPDYVPEGLYNQFAVNAEIFWAKAPNRKVVKSNTGGKTWQPLSENTHEKLNFFSDNPFDIFFITKQDGWITGSEQTWETHDGGETWKKMVDEQINSIFFSDNENGWMSLGSKNTLENYKTKDSGKTWQKCEEKNEKVRLTDGTFFISPKTGWTFSTKLTATENGVYKIAGIAKTEDGGCQWQEVWKVFDNFDIRYTDLFFINEKVGWFSTFTDNGLFQTKDGGKTWNQITIPEEKAQIETFFFKNESEGWILFASSSENPVFYKTQDGGKSWYSAPKEELIKSFQKELDFPRVSNGLRSAVVIYSTNMN